MCGLGERSVGLCDCNNFFVSCERREDHTLADRPVVVLSGNDGCVVARSNEVKAMGIPMGIPYFKVRPLLERNNVAVLSGRLALYNRISTEVMARIALYTDVTEVYSIDESFINLAIGSVADPLDYCRIIRNDILQNCGIPVSIGISSTKTLAKLASHHAKHLEEGVFWLDRNLWSRRAWMAQFPAGDVWGIGRAMAERLAGRFGIRSAADYAWADDLMLKENFSINALYTAWELRGFCVYPVSTAGRPPKSIQVSRSFGDPISSFEELFEAVRFFTLSGARQLRAARQRAGRMGLHIRTSPFVRENFYSAEDERRFIVPTSRDDELLLASRMMLENVFQTGRDYKKAGIWLTDFTDVSLGVQQHLFTDDENTGKAERQRLAAHVSDELNIEFGRVIIASADNYSAPGGASRWFPRREHGSGQKEGRDTPPLPLRPARRVGF